MEQRKVVLYIAVSLDGYIATEEHGMDWLFAVEGEGDNGFAKFYDTIDTVLIGRTTYDWILRQENTVDKIYGDKECYVFSRTPRPAIGHINFVSDDAAAFVRGLKCREGKKIWVVGGGELLQCFIKERLVDELFITIAPILLGRGIPLFKDNDFHTPLLLKNITRYNQLTELHYEVVTD